MAFRLARILPGAATIALAIATGTAMPDATAATEVRVSARVGEVARAKGPASIELQPGETNKVTIQVAANFRWRLSIGGTNPAISMNPGQTTGRAGGFNSDGNTIEVQFHCDPDASGAQSCEIEYRIERI